MEDKIAKHKKYKSFEICSRKGFQGLKEKSPAGCGLPDSYKGWVSKHNPYTILKRNFTIKKFPPLFFRHPEKDIDTLSTCGGRLKFFSAINSL